MWKWRSPVLLLLLLPFRFRFRFRFLFLFRLSRSSRSDYESCTDDDKSSTDDESCANLRAGFYNQPPSSSNSSSQHICFFFFTNPTTFFMIHVFFFTNPRFRFRLVRSESENLFFFLFFRFRAIRRGRSVIFYYRREWPLLSRTVAGELYFPTFFLSFLFFVCPFCALSFCCCWVSFFALLRITCYMHMLNVNFSFPIRFFVGYYQADSLPSSWEERSVTSGTCFGK